MQLTPCLSLQGCRQREVGFPASTRHDLPEGRVGERSFAFGDENVRRLRVAARHLPEGADLRGVQRVGAGGAVLASPHVQQAPLEVDLFPAEADEFTHPEAVPEGQQDHGGVAGSMPANLSRRTAKQVNLGLGEVLAGAKFRVGSLGRWRGWHTLLLSRKQWLVLPASAAGNAAGIMRLYLNSPVNTCLRESSGRVPDGVSLRLRYLKAYSGVMPVELDESEGQLSRWNTLPYACCTGMPLKVIS